MGPLGKRGGLPLGSTPPGQCADNRRVGQPARQGKASRRASACNQ